MGKIIVITILLFLAWKLYSNANQKWMGFYYPEGDLVSNTTYSPEFDTKEQCISWAENIRVSRPADANVDPQDLYECGKSCKLRNSKLGLYECGQSFDGGDWRRGDYGN